MSDIDSLVREWKAIFAEADAQGRDLTTAERLHVDRLLAEAEGIRSKSVPRLPRLNAIDDIGALLGPPGGNYSANGGAFVAQDPGSRFVNSPQFKAIADPSRRPEQFTTGLIQVLDGPVGYKGTLGESQVAPVLGGAAFVQTPQVLPGVVSTLFQPLALESALDSVIATTSSVRYIRQGTATLAAAAVGEGSAKPESTLGFTATDEQIRKIATFVPLSTEILEDAPAVQQFVNGQLVLFVNIAAEAQLLRGGSGSGVEVTGLLNGRGVPVYEGTSTDPKAVQLFKAMNSMRGSALIEPDWVMLHPGDYEDLRLYRDSTGGTLGAFLAGGPFFGAYGQGNAMASGSNQVTGAQEMVWNKPVYVTAAIGLSKGTALIGTRANAAVLNRGGVSVEASSSHGNFFTLNLVAIRAERRLGLAVYRSNGYVECRFH